MAILAAMTVADWAPEQLAQAEADELSPRWFTPPCLRPRPAWRAGKSSVEMNAAQLEANPELKEAYRNSSKIFQPSNRNAQ